MKLIIMNSPQQRMAYIIIGLMVSKEDPSSYQRSIAMEVGEITVWIIIQISRSGK